MKFLLDIEDKDEDVTSVAGDVDVVVLLSSTDTTVNSELTLPTADSTTTTESNTANGPLESV